MFSYATTCGLEVHSCDESSKLYTLVSSLPSVAPGHIDLDWFRSWPHISTIYSATANFEKVDHIYYERYVLEHEDGGNNALDFAVRTSKDLSLAEYEESGSRGLPARTVYMTDAENQSIGSSTEGLLIVLLHGLAGGSHEHYVRKTVTALFDKFHDDSKVSIVAFNARGCARSKVTSSTYWSALQTDDIAASLDFLQEKFPKRKVVGIGYSLGANILVNYLARFGASAKVDLAISVSNPWKLDASNANLESSWIGRVYSRRMAAGLQRLFQRHASLLVQKGVDKEHILAARSLRDFDERFTATVFGFENALAYYKAASSATKLHQVKTNLIILNAKDDIMALNPVLPYAQISKNKNLCMVATQYGGHIGWYGAGEDRWFPQVIVEAVTGMIDGKL